MTCFLLPVQRTSNPLHLVAKGALDCPRPSSRQSSRLLRLVLHSTAATPWAKPHVWKKLQGGVERDATNRADEAANLHDGKIFLQYEPSSRHNTYVLQHGS
mmetsp:Transcript_39480/g.71886  ORF Transcript_39480/g.71886 Transcript_39480/m.71886 type:complete len:101 (-) Transcript_39480:969-1271(-)